jgi:hypothetical protein
MARPAWKSLVVQETRFTSGSVIAVSTLKGVAGHLADKKSESRKVPHTFMIIKSSRYGVQWQNDSLVDGCDRAHQVVAAGIEQWKQVEAKPKVAQDCPWRIRRTFREAG